MFELILSLLYMSTDIDTTMLSTPNAPSVTTFLFHKNQQNVKNYIFHANNNKKIHC